MKTKKIAKYVTLFFIKYLSEERGVGHNTIRSYSNTFNLFLKYMSEIKHIPAESIELEHINRDTILGFLDWLENTRACSTATRNQRMAGIHSFCKFMQYEDVEHIEQWQQILSIKFKKAPKPKMNYLSVEGVKFLLEQIPQYTTAGRRDLAMLALLYDSGARVQELADLIPQSLHLTPPYYVTLFGKGSKTRTVPLQDKQVELLKNYIEENKLNKPSFNQRPLFANNRGGKFTTAGIAYVLHHYVVMAHIKNPDLIPDKITPHCLRHSKAMHMLQAGLNLVYIRDILGHVSITTTEVYARADSKQKREAIEAAYSEVLPKQLDMASWEKDSELMTWLKKLGKQ